MTRINNRQWVIFGWFLVSSLIFSAILLGPFGVLFRDLIWRIVILGGFVGISVVILKKTWAAYRLWPAFMITLIVYGVIYQIATFLPGINNSPFTLTWSEGSAYYFASAIQPVRFYLFCDCRILPHKSLKADKDLPCIHNTGLKQ